MVNINSLLLLSEVHNRNSIVLGDSRGECIQNSEPSIINNHRTSGAVIGDNMRVEEYEIAIGKLVILKQFLTHNHYESIDDVVEGLISEFLERRNNGELDN